MRPGKNVGGLYEAGFQRPGLAEASYKKTKSSDFCSWPLRGRGNLPDSARMAHLQRLDQFWTESPIVFVTTTTLNRKRILTTDAFHILCCQVWAETQKNQGWLVGRYVIMPDHVHFFCAPATNAKSLSVFVGKWKEWTAKNAHSQLQFPKPLWQPEFFDHVLRAEESYEEKWNYVRSNPVRAGLVTNSEEWPYQGELNELRMN